MDLYHAAVNALRMASLLAGGVVVFLGIMRASLEARGAGGRSRVARRIADHAALGLEFFIGAGILNLIINPTWASVTAAILTIVTRKLLTLSLNRLAQGS